MELSIIIINWNSKAYLKECLKSIYANTTGLKYEVLVIDNASFDGSEQMVAENFFEVIFIQSKNNLGFSGGNNLAARSATGELLLFLNPDTVVEKNALSELAKAIRSKPDAGAVGAKLLNTDRTLQTSCIQSFPTVINQVLDSELLRRLLPRSSLWGTASLFNNSSEPAAIEAISGACFMVKRTLFEKLNGFEESFFMYSEDLDLSFKIHRAGYKCYFVPAAVVIHHGGGSTKAARNLFSVVMMRESVCHFLKIRRGRPVAFSYRVALGISALIRLPLIFVTIAIRKLSGRSANAASLKKWIAILNWSLGFENWTKQRNSDKPTHLTESISKKCDVASIGTGLN